ncbi:nucleolar protein 14 homolog [Anopheles nili]|uniref:nucleolar protein 14 homolog n=1 Tax=Anopheles nili TaxID=185578 RepID=UPI00237A5197|nr:nucleolar protein 14 homolog [Anopheles nili]
MRSKPNRNKADAILRRKSATGSKVNPFETLVSKSKHAVLNRGIQSKNPGKLQQISLEKRDQTLRKEFELRHKTNQFLDARIKSKYARQQSKKAETSEMYNLNLTHVGQTLNEIENFDDVPDGADDDDEDGVLQDSFTSATHFGGGTNDEDTRIDRKTVIANLIAESIKQKEQRQREQDELYEMRLKLDDDLKNLMPQFSQHIRRDDERMKPDDYDRTMREMIFEKRGAPTEKLKSVDPSVEAQKKREELEREKQERMKQTAVKTSRPISADALSDDYFNEGDESNHEEEDETNDDTYGDNRPAADEADSGEEDEDEDTDDESGSDVDSLSDLKAALQQSDEDEEPEPELEPVPQVKPTVKPSKNPPTPNKPIVVNFVPKIVDVPREYEQFAAMLAEQSLDERIALIGSMVHTLKQKSFLNKSRWSVLFAYTLNYVGDLFSHVNATTVEQEFKTLHLLIPLLHDMAQADQVGIGTVFLDVVEEKYTEFKEHPRRYPSLATLMLLKLVPLLFSSSDRKHTIVTPVMVFIGEMLTRCQVRNRRDITRGLLLVTTALECVEQSQRILPTALAYLTAVLQQACPRDISRPVENVVQPFKVTSCLQTSKSQDTTSATEELQLTAQDVLLVEITDSFKIRAIACAVSLIGAVCKQLEKSPANSIITRHFLRPLGALKTSMFPASLQQLVQQTTQTLTELSQPPLAYLVKAERKPKPLRLMEPKVETVYEDIWRRPKTAVPLREQRRKLQKKVKKLARGAAREIRLDNEYLAKLQHKRRMESDRERKEKVRKIFSHATAQQGELKSLDRRAKHRK